MWFPLESAFGESPFPEVGGYGHIFDTFKIDESLNNLKIFPKLLKCLNKKFKLVDLRDFQS